MYTIREGKVVLDGRWRSSCYYIFIKELSGTNLTCVNLGRMSQFSQSLISSLNEMMASGGQNGEIRVSAWVTRQGTTAHGVWLGDAAHRIHHL